MFKWLTKKKVFLPARSEWMEGLLLAEDLYKDGWSTDGICQEFFDSVNEEIANGAYDYAWYVKYGDRLNK